MISNTYYNHVYQAVFNCCSVSTIYHYNSVEWLKIGLKIKENELNMVTFKQQDIELSKKRKRYKDFGKKLGDQIRAGKLTREQALNILSKSQKPPQKCYQFQYPYKAPQGSNAYDRFQQWDEECGKGCMCVDKNVNKQALDKLNRNKQIEPFWVCDGEHFEATDYLLYFGQKPLHYSSLSFNYKGNDKRKLHNTLKPLCSSSIIKDEKSGVNICNTNVNPFLSQKGDIKVSVNSKKRNSAKWWDDVANSLNQLNYDNEY